jgi:diguanylate cyclase (GGDEF)-like protein
MKRRTIAFIGETSFDACQGEMLAGAVKAAGEAGANLLRFTIEQYIHVNRYPFPLELLTTMLEKAKPDGLLFLGWTAEIAEDPRKFLSLLRKLGPMPLVSVGKAIEGVPSVVVDGERHVTELLEHLYGAHDKRNIAFVKPIRPDERYRAYEAFMKKRGIYKRGLVLSNEDIDTDVDWLFTRRVERIAKTLFDVRKKKVDAIMSMYSYEGVLLLEALKKRGYRVPEDIAVTSWEDLDRGRYANPPLTSVYHPFFEHAYEGVKALLELMDGGEVPERVTVPGRMSIRRSCGCPSERFDQVEVKAAGSKEVRVPLEKLGKLGGGGLRLEVLDRRKSLDCLVADIKGKTDSFVRMLERSILETNPDVEGLYRIQRDYLAVRSFTLPYLRKDRSALERAESIWLKCGIVVEENIEAVAGFNEVRKRTDAHLLQEVGQRIVTAYSFENLFDTFAGGLKSIGIANCEVYLFGEKSDALERQRLVFSLRNGRVLGNGARGGWSPLRGPLFKGTGRVLLLYFLHIGEELFGYVLFEPGSYDERVYNAISIELSNAIHGALALGDLRKANARLKSAQKTIIGNMDLIENKSRALEESNAKLSQLDRLKNNFIANITHDFRSPLSIILNSVDLGLRYDTREDFDRIVKRYNTIYDASAQLKVSVDRLLDLAKMDTRGVRLNIRRLDVRSYIENVADFYQSATLSTKIQVICSLPAGFISDFYTDVDKLEEILHNLMSNALKFVDSTGGVITITLHEKPSSIDIVIGDNGIGIPREKLETIFERYEQLGDSRSPMYKGTGIGLSFVRELMGYLKGSVRAESEGPGKGSRFVLSFPRGRAAFADTEVTEDLFDLSEIHPDQRRHFQRALGTTLADSLQQDEIIVQFSNLNKEDEFDPMRGVILIVDDNYYIREILKEYLAKAGYSNFITAANGRAGIEAIYLHRPDMIICDYNMPKMRGDELHEQLLSNPDFRRTPILFLTAMMDRDLMLERKRKGAVAYLNKPIDERELLVTIDIHMKRFMEYKLLVHQASMDELTGLANKQTIIKFLNDRVMLRTYRHLSLIFMDIDHFKSLNDTYGHRAGDALLSSMGRIIKESLRSYDKAGRYGGEEFLIVLPETPMADAVVVAEKLRGRIKKMRICHDGYFLEVTSSFGVSSLIGNKEFICREMGIDNLLDIFEVKDIQNAPWGKIEEKKIKIKDLLVEMADKALYQAKSTSCAACGYRSTLNMQFEDGRCPECGSDNLLKGRDKVVGFKG